MSDASNYLKFAIGQHFLMDFVWTKPAGIYVALFTTTPDKDGIGGVEVYGLGYDRVQHGPADDKWSEPNGLNSLTSSNLGTIQFGNPLEDWGVLKAWGLYDSNIGGKLFFLKEFSIPFAIKSTSSALVFNEGGLVVTIN